MTLLDKILHPHGHKEEPAPEVNPQENTTDTKSPEEALPPPPKGHIPSTEPVPTDPPVYEPPSGPPPEPRATDNPPPDSSNPPHLTNADRVRYAPPPTNQQTAFGNAGLLAGGVMGHMDGAGTGGGMMEGQVLGTMIGQRVHQAQNHAYWRERAMAYEAGDKSAVAAPPGPRTERAERREERRRERWERRAERRGDGSIF